MDFRRQVWKWVEKMTFFGLKYCQDLENRAARPHQELPGVPPRPDKTVTHTRTIWVEDTHGVPWVSERLFSHDKVSEKLPS